MKTLVESRKLRYFSSFYLYVMQGVPGGFALVAITNFLTGQRMSARDIAAFGAVVGLPWAFKFLWGPIVDRFQQSGMGSRRPWIIGAQTGALLAALALVLVDDPVADFNLLTAAFVVHGIFASLQDIGVDALAITVADAAERGRINAFMKTGMITGQAIGSAGLSLVIRDHGFQSAAWVQFVLLFVLTLVTISIRERPEHAIFSFRTRKASEQLARTSFPAMLSTLLRALFTRRSLLLFGAVAAVFVSERLFQRIFSLHLIQRLGWTDTAVSVLSGTYGTLSAVIVALTGGWLSDRIGALRTLLMVTLVMGLAFTFFSVSGENWTSAPFASGGLLMRQIFESLFSIAALPVLMSICKREIAAAQFGFYMALSNQADVLGIYLSGALFDNWPAPMICLACGLIILAACVFLGVFSRKTVQVDPALSDTMAS